MRLLLCARHIDAQGGAEAHVRSSAALLVSAGHEVAVATVSGSGAGLPAEVDVEVVGVPGDAASGSRAAPTLRELVSRRAPDLVHVHEGFDPASVEQLTGLVPVVWSVHAYVGCTSGLKHFRRPTAVCHRPHGPGCLAHLTVSGCGHGQDPRRYPARYREVSRALEALRDAAAVVAHSSFVAEHLASNGVQRVRVVPLFAPTPVGRSAAADPSVLFVGRLTPAKGVETLLRALEGLDGRLDIVGDGWQRQRLERLAEQLDVADRVRFHGWLRGDELRGAYRNATVVAVPSLWPEPFGLVGLEAMSAGLPVVASASGGVPDWLDARNGIAVTPGDVGELRKALRALLADPARARDLGLAGRRRCAEEFSPERFLRALEDVYGEVLEPTA